MKRREEFGDTRDRRDDDDGEEEEAGTFQKASAAELAGRKIIKSR